MKRPPSDANLYFVFTRRRDSKGRPINGQWRGIRGWNHGFLGPVTRSRAEEVQALVGAEIIPVEVEDYEDLLLQACDRAGVTPPEHLIDEELIDEELDAETDLAAQEEEVQEIEDSSQQEEEPEETENDKIKYPGYREAIEIMGDHDFEWMDVGGGRKEENVKDAWDAFVQDPPEDLFA